MKSPTDSPRFYSGGDKFAPSDDGHVSDLAVENVKGGTFAIKTDSDAVPHVVSTPSEFVTVELIKDNATSYLFHEVTNRYGLFSWRTDLPNVYVIQLAGATSYNKPKYNDGAFVGDYVIEFPATENFARATLNITVGDHN